MPGIRSTKRPSGSRVVSDRDPGRARSTALTHEIGLLGDKAEPFAELAQPLVHLPEEDLVLGDAATLVFHTAMIAAGGIEA